MIVIMGAVQQQIKVTGDGEISRPQLSSEGAKCSNDTWLDEMVSSVSSSKEIQTQSDSRTGGSWIWFPWYLSLRHVSTWKNKKGDFSSSSLQAADI